VEQRDETSRPESTDKALQLKCTSREQQTGLRNDPATRPAFTAEAATQPEQSAASREGAFSALVSARRETERGCSDGMDSSSLDLHSVYLSTPSTARLSLKRYAQSAHSLRASAEA